MAFETEVAVAFDQHLGVDGSVGAVTHSAAFAHRFMFEDMWTALITMTRGAGLVYSCHSQSCERGFHDVVPMGVMALNAVHLTFGEWMMLRQVELSASLKVALVAGFRLYAGIDDEFPPTTACGYMQAARTVAGFASVEISTLPCCDLNLRMATQCKGARDVGVAFEAGLVADEGRALDMGGRYQCAFDGAAGAEKENTAREQEKTEPCQCESDATRIHASLRGKQVSRDRAQGMVPSRRRQGYMPRRMHTGISSDQGTSSTGFPSR